MRFRKRPVTVEATQWFKNGDHPEDDCKLIGQHSEPGKGTVDDYTEGKVVRRFRRPDVPGDKACQHCGKPMNVHGWIDTSWGGHTVCPGDWIVTGEDGHHYPMHPGAFDATYEAAEPAVPASPRDNPAGAHRSPRALFEDAIRRALGWRSETDLRAPIVRDTGVKVSLGAANRLSQDIAQVVIDELMPERSER